MHIILHYCVPINKPNGTSSVTEQHELLCCDMSIVFPINWTDLRIAEESRSIYKRRFRIIFNVIRNDPRLRAEVRNLQSVHVFDRVSQRSINFLIELEVGAPFAVAFTQRSNRFSDMPIWRYCKDIVKLLVLQGAVIKKIFINFWNWSYAVVNFTRNNFTKIRKNTK